MQLPTSRLDRRPMPTLVEVMVAALRVALSLASRSVAGGGSIYGEVAILVPVVAGVISAGETTVA